MSFKLKATGVKDLQRNLNAIAKLISPQGEIADSVEDGAWVIALEARDNAVRQGLFKSGALIDSIRPLKINQYRVDVMVGVPYGAAHEFGVTVIISPKQKRFFWAMWYSTRDPMWKALALSVKYTIPARPYLRPAIDARKRVAMEVVGRSVNKKICSIVKV